MVKFIFIHGIADQTTNYSKGLFERIRAQYLKQSYSSEDYFAENVSYDEIMYAEVNTSMVDKYSELSYQQPKLFWGMLTRSIDPLALEVIRYLGDKNQTIQKFVWKQLDDILKGKAAEQIFIVAHSLGSVIAMDYLNNRYHDKGNKEDYIISLITMGSVIPVFSSALTSSSQDGNKEVGICDIEYFLSNKMVKYWINIISLRDGIGRVTKPFYDSFKVSNVSGSLPVSFKERTVSTGFLPIRAHTRYWKSNQVANIISSEVWQIEKR